MNFDKFKKDLYSNLFEIICLERRKAHNNASELELLLKNLSCFRCVFKVIVISLLNSNQWENLI